MSRDVCAIVVALGVRSRLSEKVRASRMPVENKGIRRQPVCTGTGPVQQTARPHRRTACAPLVALIDVGASVGTSINGVTGMPAEVRVVLPDGPCLWCLGVLDSARIRLENLPFEERAQLAAEGYGANVDVPVPSLAALNGIAASLAAMTLLRLHSDQGLIGSRVIMDGWEWYAQVTADPSPPCVACKSVRWQADRIARLTRSGRVVI
jgi:hypothetical protein